MEKETSRTFGRVCGECRQKNKKIIEGEQVWGRYTKSKERNTFYYWEIYKGKIKNYLNR